MYVSRTSKAYTYQVHETVDSGMDVSFASSELAALCNSEARLVARWGHAAARLVQRRLFDLAAASASTVDLVPGAAVTSAASGATMIVFSNTIVVHGVITATGPTTDHILISSLEVHGSEHNEQH